MKTTKHIILALSLLTLGGCADDVLDGDLLNSVSKPGTAVFNLSTEDSGIGVITRADGEEEQQTISELKWLVADNEGNILPHYYGAVSNRNTQLTIEGLPYGDYSLLCLATLDEAEGLDFTTPASIGDAWMVNGKEGEPMDGIYCYKKVPFTVGAEGVATDVILEHVAALVSVDIDLPNASQWRHIKRVSVTFNEELPSSLDAGGTYSGSRTIEAYDIYDPSGIFTFTTFPSETPVSGYVEIQSSRDEGDDIVQRYDFSDLQLEAGKIARVNIEYRHPEQDTGLLYIANDEEWRFNIGTMFLASEPRSVFYNNSERWFYTKAPLQIWMCDDGKLGVRYYSPYPLKDVKVQACFNKVSPEWVELVHIEEANPFMEAFLTLPITEHDCVFNGESGRKVKIAAIPNLRPSDITLRFEWDKDDEFMKKIEDINLNWFIRFSAYGADSGHPYWTHMTPLLCRLAVGLAYDMTYMFSTQDYVDGYEPWDGKFKDSGRTITLEEILTRVNRQGGLMMGCVHGVLGLGGGQTFGMSADRYYNFYPDTSPVGGETFNGARQTIFHEFAHCLGYGHDGNMTYGEAFTRFSAKVLVELGWAGRLPVSKVSDITKLPME
ncbi:MAG: hypothetical protein K2F87_04900 [Muribaculaceae bacterium]|nr:hypothetical protein [Muribaculaceae bacterium]